MAKETNTGWIKLYRSSFNNKMYFSQPFTRWQAWCDLLLLANQGEGYIRVRGIRIEIMRGQTGYSAVELANRWRWSRGKVNRFLNELEMDYQIVQQKTNATTIISIVNYKKYQDNSTANSTTNDTANSTANGQQMIQQTDTNKNEKNNKEYNNINISDGASPPAAPLFDVPNLFFMATDFNGLPTDRNEELRRFLKVVKKIELEPDDVSSLWEIFKNQYLTGTNPYKDKPDVYRHFLNWSKKQSFKKETKPRMKKNNPEKVFGVEYINDFTQCKMNDGSIQDLTENQKVSAKFQGIKPNTIVKN